MDAVNKQKISPIYFQGHKIISVSDLPRDQYHLFSGWIRPDASLQISESEEQDYVPYDDYEYWFQNYFIAEKDLNYLI